MKLKAFTLAEVLITLSIIGVVAALTIPSLIVGNQDKETAVRLKKIYSVLNNALRLAIIDYGEVDSWNLVSITNPDGTINPSGGINVANVFKNYLNVIKDCGAGSGCWHNGILKRIDGSLERNIDTDAWGAKLILADGTSLEFATDTADCTFQYGKTSAQTRCGWISVDTNGPQKPNVIGKDIFSFHLSKNSIVPVGLQEDSSSVEICHSRGWVCTAWVLLKENLNYPPEGTGWDGKPI